ncbi:MAG: FMN-binding protein [Firmicutes bacterium]|nr:FMN-binding protein [Bacillota bacterium]
MKKLIPLALCLLVILTACARAEELTGKANGYGGELMVTVRKNGEDLVGVEVTSHNETESVAGKALERIPQEILAKNGTEGVDVVSGATLTSKAIIDAVNNALGTASGAPAASAATPTDMGFGISPSGRVGPGTDVYSFNVVCASALFDGQGRIVDVHIDQLEVVSPGHEGTAPTFTGFPGQAGVTVNDDAFLKEVADWTTKRARGANYVMTAGTWAQQMDAFQRVFVGKTVDEIDDWFKKYCSDRNGRPLKASDEDAADKAKYDKLSEQEKTMLADVTTSATMSLNDAHGNILAAIRNAYDNRAAISAGTAAGAARPVAPAVPPIEPAAPGEGEASPAPEAAAVG